MVKQTKPSDEERRILILEAALKCFLNLGYSKTSMDDVAKEAKLSRPLIYLKFKNKEDLLLGIHEELVGKKIEETTPILQMKLSKKEKLLRFFEILILGPWDRIAGFPKSQEFYETCDLADPVTFQKYEKHKLKFIQSVLEDKSLSEVLACSVEGLMLDLPSTQTLKKRIEILVTRFTY